VLGAGLARGVGAVHERRRLAAAALGALGREMRMVGSVDAQRLHEAVAEVVGDVDVVGVEGGAGRIDQLDVAGRDQPPVALVVGDLLGLERVARIIDFDVADGGDLIAIVVVNELVGLDEHLLVCADLCRRADERQVTVGKGVAGRRGSGRGKRNKQSQHGCDDRSRQAP
jgi:hypothetical protein